MLKVSLPLEALGFCTEHQKPPPATTLLSPQGFSPVLENSSKSAGGGGNTQFCNIWDNYILLLVSNFVCLQIDGKGKRHALCCFWLCQWGFTSQLCVGDPGCAPLTCAAMQTSQPPHSSPFMPLQKCH